MPHYHFKLTCGCIIRATSCGSTIINNEKRILLGNHTSIIKCDECKNITNHNDILNEFSDQHDTISYTSFLNNQCK